MRLLWLTLLLLVCVNTAATVCLVDITGAGQYTGIQAAINQAANGDTILVNPGCYIENLDFNGKSLYLYSREAFTNNPAYIDSTIIDGNQNGSCIRLISNENYAEIQGFVLTGGRSEAEDTYQAGGGINISSRQTDLDNVTIKNCKIINNSSIYGGGIYAEYYRTLILSGVSLSYNNASYLGGGIAVTSSCTLTFDPVNRCSIYNNNAAHGTDLAVCGFHMASPIAVVVDTFTVANPGPYYAALTHGDDQAFSFDILNGYWQPVEADLYVAPWGSNANSGLDASQRSGLPLRTCVLTARCRYGFKLLLATQPTRAKNSNFPTPNF